GVHAVRRLAERIQDPRVRCLDGGTLGLALLPLMEDATHLLILDAISTGAPAGTLVELLPEAVTSFRFSVHDIALPDLLSLLSLRGSREIRLLGAVPKSLETQVSLSSCCEAAIDPIVSRAEQIVGEWLACTSSH
ncbi:MAG: hydrogenase maturation protease, partial [Candidatus Xenobia bacterium]